MTDTGALTLFEAAMASSTIETVSLRANQLTMVAGRAARAAMIEHGTLRAIDMRDNCARKLGLLRVCSSLWQPAQMCWRNLPPFQNSRSQNGPMHPGIDSLVA